MPKLPTASALLLALCIAGCSRPEPPPTDEPPEPQAQAGGERHTELNDAIQAPIERAQSVEKTVLDAAEQQQAEIDAQTDG